MRVKRHPRTEPFFRGLADFLNTAHRGMTEKQWHSFLKRIEKNPIGSYFHSHSVSLVTNETRKMLRVTLQEAQEIRADMHRVALAYLRSAERPDWPFDGLIACLNSLELKTQYQCFPENGKPKPGKAILHGYGKRWVSGFWPIATTTKELLFTVLAAGLVDGTLNKLKVCRWCEKYIVVEDRKRQFCPGTSCKDDFFNKRKIADGTFKTARRKQRLLREKI